MANSDVIARLIQDFEDARPLLPMYLHVILSALFPIYTGAHASLSRPASAAKKRKDKSQSGAADEDEEEVVQKMEGLSPQDAVIFPITAAIVLAGLYWLITKYGAELINLILGWYFAGIGLFSVAKLLHDGLSLVMSFAFPRWYWDQGRVWRVHDLDRTVKTEDKQPGGARKSPLPGRAGRLPLPDAFISTLWQIRAAASQKYAVAGRIVAFVDFRAKITAITILSAVAGTLFIAYANIVDCPWWLTNLQGFAVCYSALQFVSPTTFATGSLILSGLFFYDIWAVFFTPLMVTVAKNLDQPIKLVFPRPDEPGKDGKPPIKSYSMLGLGDIVLPGIMIGLALRYDLHMHYLKKQKSATRSTSNKKDTTESTVEKADYIQVTGRWGDSFWTYGAPTSTRPSQLTACNFAKPYFTASLLGYIAGMTTTLAVMTVFKHAQPALLYLVPGVLISLWGTAWARGEIKQMWNFSEGLSGEAEDVAGEADEAKAKDNSDEFKDRGIFARPFLMLWQELFGSSNDKEAVAKAEDKTETKDGKKSAKQSTKQSTKEGKESSDGDPDLLVSFSIRRLPTAREKMQSTPTEKAEQASPEAGISKVSEDSAEVDASTSREP